MKFFLQLIQEFEIQIWCFKHFETQYVSVRLSINRYKSKTVFAGIWLENFIKFDVYAHHFLSLSGYHRLHTSTQTARALKLLTLYVLLLNMRRGMSMHARCTHIAAFMYELARGTYSVSHTLKRNQ